jgi:hypothetical protein
MRKLAAILALSLLAMAVLGCGTLAVDTNVQMTFEMEVDKDGVHVWGTTNLPDGAVLVIQATSLEGVGNVRGCADHNVEVKDGRYSTYLNPEGWGIEPGRMRLYVGFMIYNQPDFIVEAFGEKGEKMEGELVREHKALGEKRIEIVDTISWGGNSKIERR